MSVWGYAWVTGSMYSTAAMFTLIAYYIIHQFPNIWGAIPAMILFNAGINSTVCPLAFPFLAILEPWLACLFVPLVWLLNSKRFKEGMRVRNALFDTPLTFDYRRLFLMVKVVARYTYETIIPKKPCLFVDLGHGVRDNKKVYEELHKADLHFFSSLALILSVLALGLFINPFAICRFLR